MNGLLISFWLPTCRKVDVDILVNVIMLALKDTEPRVSKVNYYSSNSGIIIKI